MAKILVKAKGLDISNQKAKKITIGNFYSGDRFYTLLNEYLDTNLSRKSRFMAWLIKIMFKSSNFKHDPGIANGQPWSVKLFDFFCVLCLIVFIILTLGVIGTLIPVIMGFVTSKIDANAMKALQASLIGIGVPAIIVGVPAIFWLVIFFAIRKKNKPLSLQAYVEKKISWCLKLRFLIKNTKKFKEEKNQQILVMQNFEAQGAAGPRWLNLQLINLICSIFLNFNYTFLINDLKDEELAELDPIVQYDFRMIELVNAEEVQWNAWTAGPKRNIFGRPTKEINQTQTSTQQAEIKPTNKENTGSVFVDPNNK